MSRTRNSVRALLALLLALAMSCAGVGCSTNDEPEAAPDPAPDDKIESADATHYDIDADSILLFDGNEGSARLIEDMEAGRTPTSCNVLYDQMGALPSVDVTDEATIKQIFEILAQTQVLGPSEYSITDNYHHVYFTLQDGTSVGFNFEGVGNLVRSDGNYVVVNDGPLWALVRNLQSDAADATDENDKYYGITLTGDTHYMGSVPPYAKPGEVVTINTGGIADAEWFVTLDGEELEPVSSGLDTTFSFVMPAHDVTLFIGTSPIPGGA